MPGLLGESLAILSALSFALFNIVISGSAGSRGDKGVLFSVVVTIGFSFVLFLILEAGRLDLTISRNTALGVGSFAMAGTAAMVFGRTLVFDSIRRLGANARVCRKTVEPVLLGPSGRAVLVRGRDAIRLYRSCHHCHRLRHFDPN